MQRTHHFHRQHSVHRQELRCSVFKSVRKPIRLPLPTRSSHRTLVYGSKAANSESPSTNPELALCTTAFTPASLVCRACPSQYSGSSLTSASMLLSSHAAPVRIRLETEQHIHVEIRTGKTSSTRKCTATIGPKSERYTTAQSQRCQCIDQHKRRCARTVTNSIGRSITTLTTKDCDADLPGANGLHFL